MKTPLLLLAVLIFVAAATCAEPIPVNQWLTTGPIELRVPLFTDTLSDGPDRLLDPDSFDLHSFRPRSGQKLDWLPGQAVVWQAQTSSAPQFSLSHSGDAAVYAASYLTSSLWQEVPFTVKCTVPLAVFLDGKPIVKSSSIPKGDSELSGTLTLHRGKHLLLIKVAGRADSGSVWNLSANLEPDSMRLGSLSFSTDPRRALTNFADAALFDNVTTPTLSPDGQWLACLRSHRSGDDFSRESWIEIYDAASLKLAHTIRPLKGADNLSFLPKNKRLLFTTAEKEGTTIWTYDLETHAQTPILKEIAGLNRIVCSPDEQFLYFSSDAEKPKNEKDYERWSALEDRMSDWTATRRLYAYSLASGITHELTGTGEFAFDDFALSREGNQLFFTRRIAKIGRPYYTTEFWLYDLNGGKVRLISTQLLPFETKAASFTWLPGGTKIAYATSSFTTEPADTTHNLTQCSLWLLDCKSGAATNVSRGEKFSVLESEGRSAIIYNERERNLWFLAVRGGRVVIERTDPLTSKPSFRELSTSLPYTDEFSLSGSGSCAFTASDPATPQSLYMLSSGKPRLVVNPTANVLPDIHLTSCESWSFVNSNGDSIEGWLLPPTDYRPEMPRSWPVIVYYYGGVSPRDERFTFTYHWWAANGYFVYVLNPSGCVGYGQKFADLHSNDWGTLASRDIIEGTEKLLKAKPFLDARRVGAYGGSYGGFITQDLATKTGIFAALVSDAGISNISTYFGGGSWGFTYGDIALPGSFPWNRPDIFAGKSPVFQADKIHTPLLLIHGMADENVPTINSDEMFTALKILGRDVAYVRFPGEDHSIAIKYSNYVTYREIMLEWFDKYLKDQPGAWDARWKK